MVVTGKSTSGRGITGGSWTYSYNSGGSSGDITTITAPGVTETHKFYGWGNTGIGNVWKVGLPISKSFSGAFSMSESYDWSQGSQVSSNQISNAGWSRTLGFVYDLVIYVPFLNSKSITRDGKTYTTSYSNFDTYGNPRSISETGDINRNKTVDYYWTNTSKNIVTGKPNSETVTGGFPGTDTTSWTYDANSGNVLQVNKNGVMTKYGFDGGGNLSSIIDANNHQTTFLWSNGRISQKTNPLYSISRSINNNGTIGSETNGRAYKTSFSYDNNLRLIGITPPVGNSTSLSYPGDSSYRKEIKGGYSVTYNYDGFGRPTGSSDSKGITTIIGYNAYGAKDYTDSNTGDKISYDYFGRPKQALHKDNTSVNYAYSGSNVTVTDENSATSTYTYKAFGNPDEKYLVSVRDQASNTTTYSRNILGLLTGVSQTGSSRSYSYNSKYFLTTETNPETGTISYGRDNIGNMTSISDSSGTKNYVYDNIDRLTGISSGTSSITYGYDNADNRTSMVSPSASMVYTYDSGNRITSKNETIAGRSYSTVYGYDSNDNITKVTYPSSRVVNFGFNGNNQITSIGGFVSSVGYNTSGATAGLPSSYTLSNGLVTNLSYNNRQAVTGITAGSALKVTYGYDSRGNTKTMTNNLDTTKNQSFSYDSLNRLTGFNGAWGSGHSGTILSAIGPQKTLPVPAHPIVIRTID
jgi:YD repeat-containing protein